MTAIDPERGGGFASGHVDVTNTSARRPAASRICTLTSFTTPHSRTNSRHLYAHTT